MAGRACRGLLAVEDSLLLEVNNFECMVVFRGMGVDRWRDRDVYV
jgi:hypothetical protein